MSPKRREIDPKEAIQEFEKVDWEEIKQDVPIKDSEQFYAEQKGETEEPTELELANIKIAQLEDALHKTEQFKPATQLQNPGTLGNLVMLDENVVFDWLSKRDNGITCYWYPNYGIKLFGPRVLAQLEGKGVTTFKRLYFEV